MPTLVGPGDRLTTVSGRASWLKRPSVPFPLWAGGRSLSLSGGSTVSFDQLYKSQPWVAVAVNKLTRQIARLPLKVYKRNSQNEKTRVFRGALVDLLTTPYPRCGPVHLKQSIVMPMLIHGNAVVAKYRKTRGAKPSELLPLRWQYMTPYPGDGDHIDFWRVSVSGGEDKFLAPDQVIHFGWQAPDSDIGISPLEQLGITLKAEDAAQRYSSSSFNNGVRPGGAYVLPPDVSVNAEERASLREELEQTDGGVDNALRMMILGNGGDIKTFTHTAVEAELVEARKLNREEVAAVYDLPPPLIGILDNATYSNIETQHQMLYTDVLGPWLTLIEETIQSQLIDGDFGGQFVEFDLSEVLKGDKLKEMQALREGIQNGLLTPNEGRQIQNLPRVDNDAADLLYLPTNNLGALGSEPQQPQMNVNLNKLDRARDRVLSKALDGSLEDTDPDLGRLRAAND